MAAKVEQEDALALEEQGSGMYHLGVEKKTEGIQQVLHKKATIKSKYWIKQIYFYLSTNYCISEKKHS